MKIFIDTNVLLDFIMRRDPFYAAAARLIHKIEQGAAEGYISAISFNNIHYLARKSKSANELRSILLDLRRLFRVVALDEQVIDQAIVMTLRDFEDAIQAVSASRMGIAIIATRNARDFEGTGLQPYAPEELLVALG